MTAVTLRMTVLNRTMTGDAGPGDFEECEFVRHHSVRAMGGDRCDEGSCRSRTLSQSLTGRNRFVLCFAAAVLLFGCSGDNDAPAAESPADETGSQIEENGASSAASDGDPDSMVTAALDGQPRTLTCMQVAAIDQLQAVTGRTIENHATFNTEQPGKTNCRFHEAGSEGILDFEVFVYTDPATPDREYFTEIAAGTHHLWNNRIDADIGDWSYADPAGSTPPAASDPHQVIVADVEADVIVFVTDYNSGSVETSIAIAEYALTRAAGEEPSVEGSSNTAGSECVLESDEHGGSWEVCPDGSRTFVGGGA